MRQGRTQHKKGGDKALLSALVILIVAVLYFQFLLRPILDERAVYSKKGAVLQKEITSARSLISKKRAIEMQSDKLYTEMARYRGIFPGRQDIQIVLRDLSRIADISGVKIIGIKPLPEKEVGSAYDTDVYKEIPIEIVAVSGYHQFGKFLEDLEAGKRFMLVKDLEIEANPKDSNRHDVRLVASTFILNRK